MKYPKFIVFSLLTPFFLVTSALGQERCVPSKHAKIPAIYSLTYHKARPKLLAAGWQPFWTIHHNKAATDPNTSIGNGKIFWGKGYWEIELCAGTGLAPCTFLFKDAYGNKLRVATAGEEFPRQKAFARVTSFKFVCESD
jgi:hypothetical protein